MVGLHVPRLTLDTTLLHEYWQDRPNVALVKMLLRLAQERKVDLAVTARVREDVPDEPLASTLDELPALGIVETGSVTRLDYWVLGRDQLGSQEFANFFEEACRLAEERKPSRSSRRKPPDWRDWDHLHAHWLQGRDVFLTWDEGVLSIATELRGKFGIRVMRPEDYFRTSIEETDRGALEHNDQTARWQEIYEELHLQRCSRVLIL